MPDSRGMDVLERLLAGVLDALPYPLYVIDPDTYAVVYANRTAGNHITPGEIKCYQLTHCRDTPCQSPEHPCPLRVVRDTGEPVTVTHVHRGEGEELTVWEVHAYPIRLASGEIPYVVEATVDITQRHRAQEELRHREAELRAALDATPVLTIIVDGERRIRRANRAVAEFVGASQEELAGERLGNALRCIYAEEDERGCGFGPHCGQCMIQRLVCDTLREVQPFYQREITLHLQRTPGVRSYTFWVSCVPLFNPNHLALLALEDITPLKNALTRTRRLLAYQ